MNYSKENHQNNHHKVNNLLVNHSNQWNQNLKVNHL